MANPIGNPNIAEAGKDTRFSSGNPPKKPGRKPSQLKKWIKEWDVSKDDVDAMFKNFLFAKTAGEVKAILDDKEELAKLPLAIAIQLSVLTNAAKKGDGKYLEYIYNTLYGKPKETVDLKGGLQLKVLSEAEARALDT